MSVIPLEKNLLLFLLTHQGQLREMESRCLSHPLQQRLQVSHPALDRLGSKQIGVVIAFQYQFCICLHDIEVEIKFGEASRVSNNINLKIRKCEFSSAIKVK